MWYCRDIKKKPPLIRKDYSLIKARRKTFISTVVTPQNHVSVLIHKNPSQMKN